MTTQHTTPEDSPTVQRDWVWPAVAQALPALPTGALTVIRIQDQHPAISWAATVQDLIAASLKAGNPVSYVAVDGITVPDIESLCKIQPQEGFGIILDTDLVVAVPGTDGNSYNYPCGIPTLDNINSRVGTHEHEHGNSLLVLDGVEAARPFATAGALLPPQVPVTAESIDLWRAHEMRFVAEQRTDAPTVLVWHESRDAAAQSPHAIDGLLDVAHVVVDHHCLGMEGDFLTVSARTNLTECLPFQSWIALTEACEW